MQRYLSFIHLHLLAPHYTRGSSQVADLFIKYYNVKLTDYEISHASVKSSRRSYLPEVTVG